MYNSQNGSYCQNCGNITLAHDGVVAKKKSGLAFVVFGWLFLAISLIFMPILFGVAALAMGFMIYHERSELQGIVLMVLAAASTVIGTLFSFIVSGTMFI
ncbi:hypothetical protein [Bacillus marasmi]|uniref:hypothetical protein n=1 Tax=Bacillus marasmi TaxID=1926279 RepID=UPI0011CB8BC8|nr:hypothetical protein [Bacillus marasmi]